MVNAVSDAVRETDEAIGDFFNFIFFVFVFSFRQLVPRGVFFNYVHLMLLPSIATVLTN